MKLNLGCGYKIKKGWVNVDNFPLEGVDVVLDLNDKKWIWEDNSVDKIEMLAILEHLKDPLGVLKEIHRILKPNHQALIEVPHFTSAANPHPTHLHRFNYHWFDCFVETGKRRKEYVELTFFFKKIKRRYIFPKGFHLWNYIIEPVANLFPDIYENTPLRIFPAQRVRVILTK